MFLGKWKTVCILILHQVSGTFSELKDLFKIIILTTYSNTLLPYDILRKMLYQPIYFAFCLVQSTGAQQQLIVPRTSSCPTISSCNNQDETQSYVFGLEPVL